MTLTPQSLLDGLRAGDPAAIDAFVAAHRPSALRLAEALLGDRGRAEDQVQEAFVIALDRVEQVRAPAALAAWFRQVVRSRCHRVLRRTRATPTAPDRLDRPDVDRPDPERALARARIEQRVRAAVAALPDVGRREAEMYDFEARSQAEIAAALGVPAGTVKRRLHTARGRLRDMLLGGLPGVEPDDGLPW